MNRGNTYYKPTVEITEWEDILIKKGIIAPKTKVEEEDTNEDQPTEAELHRQALEQKSLEELDEMEDDDYDDDLELRKIREKRIQEMKQQALRNKFGSIQPITKDEWTKEVNEASQDAWVVVYLFDHGVEACKLIDKLLLDIAQRHRDVKFVRIPSQNCMENWPMRNLPTLFLYCGGELQTQLLTMKQLGGSEASVQDLERVLSQAGAFGPLRNASKPIDENDETSEY